MDVLADSKLIPVGTVKGREEGLRVAEALLQGGLKVFEATFRVEGAAEAIAAVQERFPEMMPGAGTILSVEQLEQAVEAGARFAVSPGLDEAVVTRAAELGIPFFPGVATASEMQRAMNLGCRILKFFPAEVLGGVGAIKAYAPVFAHAGVRFVPTGGVSAKNMNDYLALPVVAAVGGSWMVKRDAIEQGDWNTITRLSREALDLLS